MSNYPPGVTDNDPHFDLPSVGDDESEEHGPEIVVGCDCFYCANSNPLGHLTFTAVDCSNLYPGMEAGTKYKVTRSDGVDFGQMFRRELLDMRAAYGCEIEFKKD